MSTPVRIPATKAESRPVATAPEALDGSELDGRVSKV